MCTTRKDVEDSSRRVCLIEGIEHPICVVPAPEFQARRCRKSEPCCSSVVVDWASGKVMYEGAVRFVAKGAGGGALQVTRGMACGGVVMTQRRRPQRRKAVGGRLEEYTGFSLIGRKLSLETSTRTSCRSEAMAESL